MILSIIVISHNQKWQLKRCIDSILTMPLSFEHEIIISDDASTDGTWELAQQYAEGHSSIRAFQCDTNNYNPANNSERSGWNRCNGLKQATGKYVAHIDGDDFFIEHSNIYQKQVELLELHPECSCCMANDYNLKEDENLSSATIRHQEIMSTGQVLSSETYIRQYFRESHCFVYRRNMGTDPVSICKGFYEDALLTDYYIQFGDIVCLNDAGYVYVQYKNSIMGNLSKSKDLELLTHALYIPLIIPKWRNAFLTEPKHLKKILNAVCLAYFGYKVKDMGNLHWMSKFDLFIYHAFNRKLTLFDIMHLLMIRIYLKLLINWFPKNSYSSMLLSKIL